MFGRIRRPSRTTYARAHPGRIPRREFGMGEKTFGHFPGVRIQSANGRTHFHHRDMSRFRAWQWPLLRCLGLPIEPTYLACLKFREPNVSIAIDVDAS